MIKKTLTVLAAGILLAFNSCSESGIGPKIIEPGRRDYVWTVDTIKIFSNYIHSIWGSDPRNIWGVGPGGSLTETIWHYDGNKWKTDKVGRNISPYCVYGFSKNDVWIAGQNGKIWHWDGNNWSQNYQHTINGFIGIDLYDLYGTSNNDLYAVGTVWFDNETRRGIILHYDGNKWEQKYLAGFNSYFAKVRVGYNSKCFIHCIKQDVFYNSSDTTVFYEFDKNELKEVFTDENISSKGGWMGVINEDMVFSLNNGIFKYADNSLKPFISYNIQTLPGSFAGAVFGRNEKDIFIMIWEGIAHYNGMDIKQLFSATGGAIDGQLFDNEVFFLNTTLQNGESFIYHGKLK